METSQLQFTDTHCHLYATEFDMDRDAMIAKALANGVTRMMMPNIDASSFSGMMTLASAYPQNCFPMIGLHPCSVSPGFEDELRSLHSHLANHEFVGIGETGVDLYWDKAYKEHQIIAFEEQIRWARHMALPVIIHSRESLDLNIEIIEKHQQGDLRGIFHCFGGTLEQARRIEALGFKMGIGGIITFKNTDLPGVLDKVSPASIVLETDAPYLAPVPYRGKRNESSYLTIIAEKVAGVLGISVEALSLLTNSNVQEVFGKKD